MNIKKLLKKLQKIFDRQQGRQEIEIKKLKSILKLLKKKKHKLLDKLQHETEECKIKQYQLELEILNKQLEKGFKALPAGHEDLKTSQEKG